MSEIGEWDFIGDLVDDAGSNSAHSMFVAPSAKAVSVFPVPHKPVIPRCAARFQVTSLASWNTSSPSHSALQQPAVGSMSSSRFSVADAVPVSAIQLSTPPKLGHRSAPYSVISAPPGLSRPERSYVKPSSVVRVGAVAEVVPIAAALPHTSVLGETSMSFPPVPAALVMPKKMPAQSHPQSFGRLRKPSDSPLLTSRFSALLERFGDNSDVYMALSESRFASEHRNRLLDAYAASTVFRYLQRFTSL